MTKPPSPPSHTWELSEQAMQDSERWFGDSHVAFSIPHYTLALAGEVGELADIVKKVERGSLSSNDPHVRFDMSMELADVYTYLLQLAGLMRIDLEKAYDAKRAENQRRFTIERAQREANDQATGS